MPGLRQKVRDLSPCVKSYPGYRNPGTLGAPIALFGGSLGSIPAKKSTVLHTFLKYVVSFGFKANGVKFFEL